MLEISVIGAAGRLGSAILQHIQRAPEYRLASAVLRRGSPLLGKPVPNTNSCFSDKVCAGASVVIDVSSPQRLGQTLAEAREHGSSVVVATTGHREEGRKRMQAAAASHPILFAPNLSMGVALLKALVSRIAGILKDADAEIVEVHHNRKADAPSGTARLLLEAIQDARQGGVAVGGREGLTGPRSPGEIGVHAVRMGDVVGEHTVSFAWDSQRLELSHKAHSREVFAAGALAAARFISTRGPGLYTVEDMVSAWEDRSP